jgi:hypothetical protein
LSKKQHDKANSPCEIIELGSQFIYKRSNRNVLKAFQNATNLRLFRSPEKHRQKYDILPAAHEDCQSEPVTDEQPEIVPDDTVDDITLQKMMTPLLNSSS